MKTIEIDITSLEIVISSLFNRLKSKEITRFQFSKDFYWSVPEEDLTDLDKAPELHVGSLKDDIDFINSLVREDYDASFLELERLSSIFKAISWQLAIEKG